MRRTFFHLLLFLLVQNIAFGGNFYSRPDGIWSTVLAGPDCSCVPGPDDIILVSHDIIIAGNFTLNTGSMVINSSSLLTITGDLVLGESSMLTTDVGSTLRVNQNLLNQDNSSAIVISGDLIIDGNFTNGTGLGLSTVINFGLTGTISVGGICSNFGLVINKLGSFTGCDNSVLPVELLYFVARAEKNSFMVDLEWATSTELNSDYFTIERSLNGVDFDSIGYHKAAGNSQHIIKYTWSFLKLDEGNIYYRLKEVGRDGTYTYFDVISSVTVSSNGLQVSPNPVHGNILNIRVENPSERKQMFLYDTSGQLIRTIDINNVLTRVELEQHLSPGIYLLKSTSNGSEKPTKIIAR
ncbi:T9SS type A sorting domain-containing protein [Fulvivirga sp. M361]|uniref:T9SS type A sorting domain-containing protein n=1 Tax=Fulvivirga sp. M361 TaxID=2594266 RepID=UPI00117B42F2|nr:T9SS type A sorting domain-containing protein [Fulvivirga sp. M361]TRX47200.1 T9SS type A sorting domain-containing protein [Fulvivirga sp. M361]